MLKIPFKEEASSRKGSRFIFVFQVSAMILAAGLSLMDQFVPALAILSLSLIIFIAGVLWLYSRYRNLPLIREKRVLEHFVRKFQKRATIDARIIQTAHEERRRLLEAEQEDIERTIEQTQQDHVESGLSQALIREAVIAGVDAALKEFLAGHHILSAAQITQRIRPIPGIGETQREALFGWQRSVREELHRTRPRQLDEEQLGQIQERYQALQEKNGLVESRARSSREILQHEIASFRQRLRELERLTFLNYMGRSLFPTTWKPRPSRSNW